MADEEPRQEKPEEGEAPAPQDPLALKDLQIADLTNDLKRLQAEFDNHKKRTDKEWTERSRVATQAGERKAVTKCRLLSAKPAGAARSVES